MTYRPVFLTETPDETLNGVRLTFVENRKWLKPVQLAPEGLTVLAEVVAGNFGELEGALNSLVVHAASVGTPLTRESAASLLEELKFRAEEHSVNLRKSYHHNP